MTLSDCDVAAKLCSARGCHRKNNTGNVVALARLHDACWVAACDFLAAAAGSWEAIACTFTALAAVDVEDVAVGADWAVINTCGRPSDEVLGRPRCLASPDACCRAGAAK